MECKSLKNKKNPKVKNHCHYTEEYRGAAHSICNLKFSVAKKVPIAFHDPIAFHKLQKIYLTYYNLLIAQDL